MPPADAPVWWTQACRHLARRDRVMKRLLAQLAPSVLPPGGDAFATLARAIVGQQISTKAAQAIWLRLLALGEEGGGTTQEASRAMQPAVFLHGEVARLRAAGLSARKVDYLTDLATHFDQSRLDPAQWPQMEDDAIIAQLMAVRGIGRWTAQMLLIFHLRRPDVLPLDDAGLIRGISQNYFSGEAVSRSEAREVAAAWHPWATVATWYIWRSLEATPVIYP